jgi:hypothetical protein
MKYPKGKPLAGNTISMVPSVPTNEQMKNTWSQCKHDTFSCRIGPNYSWNGKKAPSPPSLMNCVGMEFVKCDKRIDNIGSRVKIPDEWIIETNNNLIPSIFIVNVQVPAENPVTIFQEINDGPGYSLTYYFQLKPEIAESYKDLSTASPAARLFAEYCMKAPELDNESKSEFKGKFKVCVRCENIEEFGKLSTVKRKKVNDDYKPYQSKKREILDKIKGEKDKITDTEIIKKLDNDAFLIKETNWIILKKLLNNIFSETNFRETNGDYYYNFKDKSHVSIHWNTYDPNKLNIGFFHLKYEDNNYYYYFVYSYNKQTMSFEYKLVILDKTTRNPIKIPNPIKMKIPEFLNEKNNLIMKTINEEGFWPFIKYKYEEISGGKGKRKTKKNKRKIKKSRRKLKKEKKGTKRTKGTKRKRKTI